MLLRYVLMTVYTHTIIGTCLAEIWQEVKQRDLKSIESLQLRDVEHVCCAISDEENLTQYHKNMEILRYFNVEYKKAEDRTSSYEDQYSYIYMGYVVRAVMARYKMEYKAIVRYEAEYKHPRGMQTDSVAVLENFHGRLRNLESCLPTPHHRSRLP